MIVYICWLVWENIDKIIGSRMRLLIGLIHAQDIDWSHGYLTCTANTENEKEGGRETRYVWVMRKVVENGIQQRKFQAVPRPLDIWHLLAAGGTTAPEKRRD